MNASQKADCGAKERSIPDRATPRANTSSPASCRAAKPGPAAGPLDDRSRARRLRAVPFHPRRSRIWCTTIRPGTLKVQLERDSKLADEKLGAILNAIDPNLKAFKARGGKLILYHGWNDAALPPLNTINYFESVRAE